MRNGLGEKSFRIGDLNIRLIILVLVLCVTGVLLVNSATDGEVTSSLVTTTVKQVAGIAGGLVVMSLLAILDYRKLVKYSWIFYLLSIGSLVYVLFFTEAISGAHRWIHIRLLGTIQPSEFAKPALILFLTFIVAKMKENLNRFPMLLLFLLGAAPVLVLVLKEPDLSTSVVLILIVIMVLFIGGISYKWVIGVLLFMVPFIAFFFVAVYQPGQTMLTHVLEDHQLQRINAYFFPEEYPSLVYQQNNSVMAIGSGGLFGKGLRNSSLESVKNGDFLSEESCDFIFAVVGEELGYVGSVVLILLVVLLVFECFRTAAKCRDLSGKIIAGTAGGMLALQSFINIGVATLLLPNTGIPLPFVSAGLSSLLSTFILMGLVLSVGLHGQRKRRGRL